MISVKPLIAAAATAVWLSSMVPAYAVCVAPGFNPQGGRFCDGCKYEAAMTLPHDQACERPYDTGMGAIVEFHGHRILQRAKHGIAGFNGLTFAYAPAKGYVGNDDFTIEVDYRQFGQNGKFIVHWNVTVQ